MRLWRRQTETHGFFVVFFFIWNRGGNGFVDALRCARIHQKLKCELNRSAESRESHPQSTRLLLKTKLIIQVRANISHSEELPGGYKVGDIV